MRMTIFDEGHKKDKWCEPLSNWKRIAFLKTFPGESELYIIAVAKFGYHLNMDNSQTTPP